VTADLPTVIGTVLLGGLTGAFAGGVIHVVAVRLPVDLAPIGPMVCSRCQGVFPSDRFIPGRRGTCPSCGAMLPGHKPATEAAAAGITVLALLLHGLTYAGFRAAAFSLVLLLILRIDWQYHLIYPVTIVGGLILALGVTALHSTQDLASAAVAAAGAGAVFLVFFALAFLLYRQQALGFGDVLLATVIGAMTGFPQVVLAIFIGMVIAVAAGGIIALMIDPRRRHGAIPYDAYLCIAGILVLKLS
jgi:leader peptidase (prepilin peptidase)/N-methyltransferase